MIPELERTTVQLYRDCLRVAKHIGGDSAKGVQLRGVARSAFKRNAGETDPEKIKALRADAVRALSNYLVMQTLKTKKDHKNHLRLKLETLLRRLFRQLVSEQQGCATILAAAFLICPPPRLRTAHGSRSPRRRLIRPSVSKNVEAAGRR